MTDSSTSVHSLWKDLLSTSKHDSSMIPTSVSGYMESKYVALEDSLRYVTLIRYSKIIESS